MPSRSPLPQRQGLDAAWLRTPDNDPDAHPRWATMRDFLVDRLPDVVPVAERLEVGEFVDQAGRPWTWEEL
ncbi:MAG TPA: pseudouridylate synthase, partial [Dermatophilaceae bacterium]